LVCRREGWSSGQELAEAVAALPRVSAVEVVVELRHGGTGILRTGIVIYNDW